MAFGVVLFALAIAVSIMLHEAGHLLAAKRFGMKATQYFVGFGPTLWSFRRGETEYGVKAIPAGGFVKIVGMTPLERVDPADEPRAFYRQSAPKRAVVLAAGSVMHFLIAVVVLYVAAVVVGLPSDRPVVAAVQPCVVVAAEDRVCRPDDPVSPAAAAGIQAGDRIVAFDSRPTPTFEELSAEIRGSGGGTAALTVLRDGQRRQIEVDLVRAERPSFDDPSRTEQVGVLGVARELTRTYGPVAGVGRSVELTGMLFTGTWEALQQFPEKVPLLVDAIRDDAPRDPNTPISVVGAARAGGQAVAADQVVAAFALLAGLNVFIGVFNLFPLLPLDGGHLAILGFEQARSRIARALGRRDPGRVDITKLLPLTYVVVLVFAAVSVLAITADVVNPIENLFD